MVEVALAVLAKISESLVSPIGNQFSYIFQLSGNVKTLEKELENLKILKVCVQQEVDLARNNVHTIWDHVETWLGRVGTVESEACRIVEHNAQFPKGCLNGWCLNLKPRYVLSRQAKKKTEDIGNLLQEGNFSTVSLPPRPEQFIGSTSTEVLNSREVILNEITEILKDEDVNLIGLCGTGGMGKTTMVEKVFNRVKEEKMFDDCVMTVVSQKAEMINVQREIAESLKLTFEENNLNLRAGLLKKRLEGKKVLVILDDVWEEFELKALGITFQDGQRGCKVVFTSRTQGLWREHGSRRRELLLQTLPDDESWNLFVDKIGDSLNDEPEVLPIAKQIVKECAGLPLALGILGSALRGQKKYVWSDTLHKLISGGVDDKVCKILRVSYDHLGDEEAKSVFLLCSLFEEDSHIDVENLVNMGIGLRLFRRIDIIEEARDRVLTLVDHLKSRCLISIVSESDTTVRFIKVHDVVRDVSKSIAFSERGSLVLEHGFTLKKSLEESSTDRYTWISDISGESKELLSKLRFPRLELLRCSKMDLQISDSFFERMVKLQFVEIITRSSYPPPVLKLTSSLECLKSLHTLCLRNFRLMDFTAFKFLSSLEILRIGDTHIEELPKEIGQLTELRLLDMSDCGKLKKILPGIISGLSHLEELYLGGFISDWGAEESGGGNAVNGEFESLSSLRVLHFAIKDPRMLPRTPLLENLKKYQIQIGNAEGDFISASRKYEKKVSISNVVLAKDFDCLLHNSEALLLRGEPTKSLVSELVRQASQSIKYLEIRDTDAPEYLTNATDHTKEPFLVSTLESLTLSHVNNLQHIINGPLVAGHFTKLKKLDVSYCNQLRNIFRLSNGVDVSYCKHLETLQVSYCERMEEVICWDRTEEDTTSKLQFPKLKVLEIITSDSPVCFCRGAKEIEFHQLETLSLMSIPAVECITSSVPNDISLNSIFPHKVFFPKLVEMTLYELEKMKEIWCGRIQSNSFVNLPELYINRCYSLEYVFSPYTAACLVHLRTLFIFNCPSLKEIVNGPLLDMVGSLLNLNDLRVYGCNQLRNIFRLSTAANTVGLRRLHIKDCGSMEEVISWESRPEDATTTTSKLLFPLLESLVIKSASSSLICFCKGATEIEFHQLTDLSLWSLPAVKCIVSISHENPLNYIFPHKVFFPKLVEMTLYELRNMKEIVNGPLLDMVGSLLNLNDLRVERCNQLRNIFRLSTAANTVGLKLLLIEDCESMEEVISWEGRPEDATTATKLLFPRLESLDIKSASSLVCFCKGATEIEFHKLTYLNLRGISAFECLVSISHENPLNSVFPHKVFFPKLVEMRLYELENMKEIWCGRIQSNSFVNLSELMVLGCDSLEYVFSPCTARYLVHLSSLVIADCKNLKEVVSAEKEVDGIEEHTRGILPKLKDVQLYKLPTLESFYCVPNDIEFPELDNVVVVDCPVFKFFSPVSVHTPILRHVKLYQENDYWPIRRGPLEEEKKVTMWKGDLNSTIQHLHKIQIQQKEKEEEEERRRKHLHENQIQQKEEQEEEGEDE